MDTVWRSFNGVYVLQKHAKCMEDRLLLTHICIYEYVYTYNHIYMHMYIYLCIYNNTTCSIHRYTNS